jgi:catechol 2,3-dioxygenase-like lactoylglutathione lyase family enzyme
VYRILFAFGFLAVAGWQQTPAPPSRDRAIYGHVAHLGWVVKDLDAIVSAWRTLGVTNIQDAGVLEIPMVENGQQHAVKVRRATAQIGTQGIHWIQPLGGSNVFTAFLASHGEGVHHVAFHFPSRERFDEEVRSLAAAGIRVAQEGAIPTAAGLGRFAYLDTAREGGGIGVELEYNPAVTSGTPQPSSANEDPFNRITQFAFVVHDIKAVGDYWTRFGLGGFAANRNVSLDRVYRDRPGQFEMLLGFNRAGEVPFEWIQPLVGPSVYEEYIAAHHEGLHHLGFDVTDFDAAVARLKARGLAVTMSGRWDSNGSQGRFAYLDTERHGGVTIELLWNKPRP